MRTFRVSSDNAIIGTSSNGNLLKWCIKENGRTIYIKTSSINRNSLATKWMYESYSEAICSRLFKELGVDNVVQYYLCKIIIDNSIETIGCYSYSFLKKDEQQLTLAHLNKIGKLSNYVMQGYNGYIQCIKEVESTIGIHYKNEIDKIITLDYIVLNCDRHFGNLGFVYNSNTGMRIQYIFDNGDSLFASKNIDGMNYSRELDTYIKSKPFTHIHDEQIKYTDFNYVRHLKLNITETLKYIDTLENRGLTRDRIRFIKQLLVTRINILKNIDKTSLN